MGLFRIAAALVLLQQVHDRGQGHAVVTNLLGSERSLLNRRRNVPATDSVVQGVIVPEPLLAKFHQVIVGHEMGRRRIGNRVPHMLESILRAVQGSQLFVQKG